MVLSYPHGAVLFDTYKVTGEFSRTDTPLTGMFGGSMHGKQRFID